jgi:hypothetical protein
MYGWMVHTRFFSQEAEAHVEYGRMRDALAAIIDIVPDVSEAEDRDKMRPVYRAVASFIERFP